MATKNENPLVGPFEASETALGFQGEALEGIKPKNCVYFLTNLVDTHAMRLGTTTNLGDLSPAGILSLAGIPSPSKGEQTLPQAVTAYHFTELNQLRDGRPIPAKGEWLVHEGRITPCFSGLHASPTASQALGFAPGPLLHLVELEGELVAHGNPIDKWVGRRRRIIDSVNATPILWKFARFCARSVAHLWEAPDVVLEYLLTGDESLRSAVMDAAAKRTASLAAPRTIFCVAPHAARDAAVDAAWDAARASAWDAARASAWEAATDAAMDAARDAARASAWDAARASAWEAATDPKSTLVPDAAKIAAGPAVWIPAWDAVRGVARDALAAEFQRLVDEAFNRRP